MSFIYRERPLIEILLYSCCGLMVLYDSGIRGTEVAHQ